jgi:hypothetical protein
MHRIVRGDAVQFSPADPEQTQAVMISGAFRLVAMDDMPMESPQESQDDPPTKTAPRGAVSR